MSSREKILSAVGANQPAPRELPTLPAGVAVSPAGLASQFIAVLESIGGAAYTLSGFASIATILHEQFPAARRVISGCPELPSFGKAASGDEGTQALDDSHAHMLVDAHAADDPHTLENVDLAILPAHFGVAENGACWITESQMLHRALPFITQHLALVIHRRDIVADMHQAYDRIADLESAAATGSAQTAAAGSPVDDANTAAGANAAPYGFATFIAGPSKTADIEQSLVLGAHGPISLTVFLLDEQLSDAGFY
jgi:L-lactate dehydrogenase complex protein LldG